MKITIEANTDLSQTLTQPEFRDLIDWFRSQGIDPDAVPQSQEVVIYNDAARAKIDYWQDATATKPAGAKILAVVPFQPERSLAHLEVPIISPLPDHLVNALTDVREGRIEWRAKLAGEIAAAEVRAEASGQ
jgi:hypothetical protein